MKMKVLLDSPPWEWPRDAGRQFLDALKNRSIDESERLIAAQLADDLIVINDRIAKTLLGIVGNAEESEALRGTAAIALGAVLEQASLTEFEDPEEVPIREETYNTIQDSFERFLSEGDFPKLVRRKMLEASVRAPEPWHPDLIREAYVRGDEEWKLTAVFAMRWVRGFDKQILEALNSSNDDTHREAVMAAGNWQLDGAWSHVVALVKDEKADKDLRLAAIDAVASIRPTEAGRILVDLSSSEDEDIAEAASEAMMMADASSSFDDEDDDEDEDEEEEEDEAEKDTKTGKWLN
jgi:hypothetical protein